MNLTRDNFPLCSEDRLVQVEFVKQGLGIGFLPQEICDKLDEIIPVLTDLQPFEADMWLVTHRELRTNRRIKKVFDFLVAELASS